MPQHNNPRCHTKLGSLKGMLERFEDDDNLSFNYNTNKDEEEEKVHNQKQYKWILLGIISQDSKTQHYQFHSVNTLNTFDNNNQMNNHSTITHYLYLVGSWHCSVYNTPESRFELKFLDLKTNIAHNLQDVNNNNQNFTHYYYCDELATVYQSVSFSNDISTLKDINLENLQPLNDYQLLNIIFWIKLDDYSGTRIILNFKNILLSKALTDEEYYNQLFGSNFWGSKDTILSFGNVHYLNNVQLNTIESDENKEKSIWVPFISYSSKSIDLYCINNDKQDLRFSNVNALNVNNYSDNYISLIKSGNNLSVKTREFNNEQFILHFIKKSGKYKLFYFDTKKLQIFEKIVKNIELLKDLEIIDNCPLNENLYLLAMKREDLFNRVKTIEEYLLYECILFFILDLNSFTIKEISPIIYPLALNKHLKMYTTNNTTNNTTEKDGFQIVTPKRNYLSPNTEIYVGNRVDINGGITNDVLFRCYLLRKDYYFGNNLLFRNGVKMDDFSMTCFREFNETNKDIFNVTLSFNQKLKLTQTCEPFFITLYFKVKDCCSGVLWFNNQLLSDVSINFR